VLGHEGHDPRREGDHEENGKKERVADQFVLLGVHEPSLLGVTPSVSDGRDPFLTVRSHAGYRLSAARLLYTRSG
jgi:hypothetical protein